MEMNETPKKISVADGIVSDPLGIVKSLPNSLNGLNILLDFLVAQKPPLDLIIELHTLEAP